MISASSHSSSQLIRSGTYNDLNEELQLENAPVTYDAAEVSCASSAGAEHDLWSREMDWLDNLEAPELLHRSEAGSVTSDLHRQAERSVSDLAISEASGSYSTSTKIGKIWSSKNINLYI